eukprot:scaffold445383_cov22-Prasinocladus_malaysianus.AAC.1
MDIHCCAATGHTRVVCLLDSSLQVYRQKPTTLYGCHSGLCQTDTRTQRDLGITIYSEINVLRGCYV